MDKDDSKGVDFEEFLAFWKEEVRKAPATQRLPSYQNA